MRQERLDALLGRNEKYKYDAFISCTREGAKWIKRHFIDRFENDKLQLKFCVAQRDFLVGKTIIDNIMDTISQSRKTILLVDETFINSKWCQEELLLSHHVSTLICWLKNLLIVFDPQRLAKTAWKAELGLFFHNVHSSIAAPCFTLISSNDVGYFSLPSLSRLLFIHKH